MNRYWCEWRGPVEKKSGLGIASRAYVRALRRQGVNVRVGSKTLKNLGTRRSAVKKVLIWHYPPHQVSVKKERKRYDHVILNTVWETTQIPNHWKPHMNKFDAVFVPTLQNKEALLRSGVKVPIFIVPHGVNTMEYRPGNPKLNLPEHKRRFIFVSVFGFQHRKNPEGLLRAYWEEFSASDSVLLVIKTNGYDSRETEAWIKKRISQYKKKLGLNKSTAPVKIIGSPITPGQLRGIYTLGDAFVLPTRGEGVGMPFLEAMASGIPVIATGWGGHMDFLNSRNSFLVKYKLRNPAVSMRSRHAISRKFSHLFAQQGQRWAEPELQSLRKQMRTAYENPRLCKMKGRQGRQDTLKLSWDRGGRLMKRAIEQVIKGKK
ncbi:glycosyltransferase family 4 protein [Paenibacillus durus]|uniref:Glycosyl transferase family 1 n=1 Tax=Paenibacillus durus ATCC 35681 TaxID=1333534 RepID=A0A0F7F8S9_PAEDU|nr:glycosyltransferase family 4 protein [Paenibacillus durus]AKG34168.1 glycosyl transferase family 1 [Paenibacillus durus ATCC 35681]